MDIKTITEHSIINILADEAQRTELIALIEAEEGTFPPLINLYLDVAEQCDASPEQIRKTVQDLFNSYGDKYDSYGNKYDWLIKPFVFHPNVPDDVLYYLYERNVVIIALGHRKGPQDLLERLANEHKISEAIITLVLSYYLKEPVQVDKLLEFVRLYREDSMLRNNLLKSKKLNGDVRTAVLEIYNSK